MHRACIHCRSSRTTSPILLPSIRSASHSHSVSSFSCRESHRRCSLLQGSLPPCVLLCFFPLLVQWALALRLTSSRCLVRGLECTSPKRRKGGRRRAAEKQRVPSQPLKRQKVECVEWKAPPSPTAPVSQEHLANSAFPPIMLTLERIPLEPERDEEWEQWSESLFLVLLFSLSLSLSSITSFLLFFSVGVPGNKEFPLGLVLDPALSLQGVCRGGMEKKAAEEKRE